jgi:hypothetical protein
MMSVWHSGPSSRRAPVDKLGQTKRQPEMCKDVATSMSWGGDSDIDRGSVALSSASVRRLGKLPLHKARKGSATHRLSAGPQRQTLRQVQGRKDDRFRRRRSSLDSSIGAACAVRSLLTKLAKMKRRTICLVLRFPRGANDGKFNGIAGRTRSDSAE